MKYILFTQALKEKVGYLPQRFGLYGDLTVLENIHFYADLYQAQFEDAPPAVAVAFCPRGDAARIGTGVGLGHAEGDVEVAGGGPREEGFFQLVGAEHDDRVQTEDRQMHR